MGAAPLQMPQPRSRSWAVRLLGLTYGIFCVIVLSSYTANLAAFLTARSCCATIRLRTLHLSQAACGLRHSRKLGGKFQSQSGINLVGGGMRQVQQLGTTIDSPLSLLRNGGNFAVSSGGSTLAYFRSALDPVAAALAPRCPSSLPCTDSDVSAAMPTWCSSFATAH